MRELIQVRSHAVVLMRPDIDTDQIIPAAFLKSISRDGIAAGLFHGWRFHPDGTPREEFALNRQASNTAEILIAGENFGCGSSREHAVWALLDSGFRVVVSTGFADIFRANALRLGLLPVEVDGTWVERAAAACLDDPALEVEADLQTRSIRCREMRTTFEIDEFSRHCLLQGIDSFDYLLAQSDAIERFSRSNHQTIDTGAPAPGGGKP